MVPLFHYYASVHQDKFLKFKPIVLGNKDDSDSEAEVQHQSVWMSCISINYLKWNIYEINELKDPEKKTVIQFTLTNPNY